jgi:hypothetical protein
MATGQMPQGKRVIQFMLYNDLMNVRRTVQTVRSEPVNDFEWAGQAGYYIVLQMNKLFIVHSFRFLDNEQKKIENHIK